jgi:hypothetical protein
MVQHGPVDAAGQVAQLSDGILGARASPSFMATATIWACVPSCRSRSIRRSRAAKPSTARARLCSSSCIRCGNGGPMNRAISFASAALPPFTAHGVHTSTAGGRGGPGGGVSIPAHACTGGLDGWSCTVLTLFITKLSASALQYPRETHAPP